MLHFIFFSLSSFGISFHHFKNINAVQLNLVGDTPTLNERKLRALAFDCKVPTTFTLVDVDTKQRNIQILVDICIMESSNYILYTFD